MDTSLNECLDSVMDGDPSKNYKLLTTSDCEW